MDYINLGYYFSVLHRKSQMFITAACEHLELTYAEYALLLRLYNEEGVSQEKLAELLFLDKAVIARTITLLEKKELIRREQSKKDKRVKRVYLTERALMEKDYLQGVLRAWIRYISKDFETGEMEQISRNIEKLALNAADANIQGLVRNIKDYKSKEAGKSAGQVE